MLSALLGSLLGGVFRIIPEVIKWLDRKNERDHELALLKAEMEFSKLRADLMKYQTDAVMQVGELEAMSAAIREQGETSKAAGKIIAAISALVRPLVTYAFVIVYFLVKFATFLLAIEQGGEWKEVLVNMWNQDDMAILMLILTFWFVGRVWDRTKS